MRNVKYGKICCSEVISLSTTCLGSESTSLNVRIGAAESNIDTLTSTCSGQNSTINNIANSFVPINLSLGLANTLVLNFKAGWNFISLF